MHGTRRRRVNNTLQRCDHTDGMIFLEYVKDGFDYSLDILRRVNSMHQLTAGCSHLRVIVQTLTLDFGGAAFGLHASLTVFSRDMVVNTGRRTVFSEDVAGTRWPMSS
jgi:hypothetical protein